MTAYELVAKISLDTSGYDKGLAKAKSGMQTFGGSLKAGFGKLASMAGVALAGASAAVTAFGVKSVKTGMSFDKSMSQVAATMGMSVAEINKKGSEANQTFTKLRDFAKEMGRTTAFSATQASDALNYMALAGYDAEKSMRMLPTVLNMAAAGSMDLARASDMVTDTSTALGLSEEQTVAMTDQMAAAASKSNTSVEQLGDAMLRVGGTAKMISGGTQELSTALGILADNGTKGAEAGTAMRNILMSLSNKKFEKTFGAMGISAYDAEGNMRPLKDVFLDLNKAMDGMTNEEKTKLISQAFNARDMKNINALLGTSAQRWDELSAAIGDSEGAAAEMANVQLDNLSGDMTLFKSALEGAQIAISDKLSPALRGIVQEGTDGVSKMAEQFNSGDFAGAMETMGQTIGNIGVAIMERIPDVVSAGAMLLTGIVEGVISNAPKLFDSFTGIVDQAMSAFEGLDLGELGSTLLEGIGGALSGLEAIGDTVMTAGKEILSKLGEGAVQGIPEFLAGLMPMLLQFSEYLRANAGMMISAGIEFVLQLAQGLINGLPTLIAYVPQIITNIAGIINDNAPKLLVGGIRLITMLAQGLISAIPVIVSHIPQILQAIVSVFLAFNWLQLGSNIITFIKDGIKALATAIPEALRNIGNTAIEWLSAIQWSTLGADIIDLILIGLQALASAIPTALKAIASTAANAFKAIPWGSIGRTAIMMLVAGVRAVAGLLKSVVAKPVNAIKSVVSTGFNAAKNVAVKAFEGIKNGISEKIESAKNKVKSVINAIKGFFPFNVGKIFSGWIPKIKLFTKKSGTTASTSSNVSQQKFAKAMNEPYMFKRPTEFYAGEAGDEMLYGRRALMEDIGNVVDKANATSTGTTVYITNHITVDGADDPEDFADRLVRKMQLDMRTA